jgi:hypothetical protein
LTYFAPQLVYKIGALVSIKKDALVYRVIPRPAPVVADEDGYEDEIGPDQADEAEEPKTFEITADEIRASPGQIIYRVLSTRAVK